MKTYRTPIPALLGATLQSGLNAVLDLDDNSSERLSKLQGRVLKLELEGVGIEYYFSAEAHGVEVGLEPPGELKSGEDDADTTVRGTPAALFSMAASELGEGWSGPGSQVNISGDAALARDFERLFSRLDPDIEGALSGLFGDVLGYQFAFGLKQGARRARTAASTAREVLGEVLREGARGGESGPVIGSEKARRFADEVDALRDGVERLEAKIRNLEPGPAQDRNTRS
jgi:ubiquinone biosynthesis protein UbiJ